MASVKFPVPEAIKMLDFDKRNLPENKATECARSHTPATSALRPHSTVISQWAHAQLHIRTHYSKRIKTLAWDHCLMSEVAQTGHFFLFLRFFFLIICIVS